MRAQLGVSSAGRGTGTVVAVLTGSGLRRLDRHARGGHHALKGGNSVRRGFEVPEPVAFRDDQWRPAMLVLAIPDVNVRALIGKQLNDGRQVFVGSTVHRSFAIVVHCVDVVSKLQSNLDGFEYLAL